MQVGSEQARHVFILPQRPPPGQLNAGTYYIYVIQYNIRPQAALPLLSTRGRLLWSYRRLK